MAIFDFKMCYHSYEQLEGSQCRGICSLGFLFSPCLTNSSQTSDYSNCQGWCS